MAVDVRFEPVTAARVRELARTMRIEDQLEVHKQGFDTPLQALHESLERSEVSLVVTFDGQAAAIFGVRPTLLETALGRPLEGVVWILTGDVVNKHPRAYLRHSKEVMRALLSYCPVLRNYIDANHAPALRWAKWAGLSLGEPVGLPPYGLPFVPFELRR